MHVCVCVGGEVHVVEYACVHVCMCVYVCICAFVGVCLCVCGCVWYGVCACVYLCVCMYYVDVCITLYMKQYRCLD